MKRRPDPIPHQDEAVGEIGYQLWVWAAKWAPTWLSNQPDPAKMFAAMNAQIRAEIDQRTAATLKDWNTPEQHLDIAENEEQAVMSQVYATQMPQPEVADPAWDDLEWMGQDPALDQPPTDWINHLEPQADPDTGAPLEDEDPS